MFAKPKPAPISIHYHKEETQLWLERARVPHAAELVDGILASLPELHAFMAWSHFPENNTVTAQQRRLEAVESAWDEGKDFVYHLYVRVDGNERRFAGCIALHPRCLNPKGMEIGYWVRSDDAGQGLCTLATKIVTAVAFKEMGLERVQVGCDVDNLGSRRVIEKAGFHHEGTQRKFLPSLPDEYRANGWLGSKASEMYALTDEDLSELAWLEDIRAHLTLRDAEDGDA